MNTMDIFKRYDSPEQYAEAFQQMIDAREKWREQIREPSPSLLRFELASLSTYERKQWAKNEPLMTMNKILYEPFVGNYMAITC